jgi:signal transduction histidine kinase/CheY-like chemotaxis protein/HPt (histidine-containing phosphotransfer) domain-containing protein
MLPRRRPSIRVLQQGLRRADHVRRTLLGQREQSRRELEQARARHQSDARRALLSAMVADLASGFVNAPIESVDQAMRQSLQELCHSVGADRIRLATWDAASGLLTWGDGWARRDLPDVARRGPTLDLSGLPAWHACASEGRTLEINSVAAFAADDALRRLLGEWGVGSLLAIPLMEEERCTGFLVLETIGRDLRWGHDEFSALMIAAELFSNTAMRRQRESALERALGEARSALRAKDAFLANMSHELRTPLNGVIGMARLLDTGKLQEAQRAQVRTIVDSGQGLLRILNDLVDFARLEAGNLGLENGPVDLRQTIGELTASLAASFDAARLRLEVRIEASVPRLVSLDAARLRQMLGNLLANALRHTTSGGATLGVAVQHGRLHVTVSDTGCGMDAELLGRLFRPFEQADSSHTRAHGGLGLGLAICHRVCRLMGGAISVTSEPGRGSCFTLDLPLHELSAPEPVPPPVANPAPPTPAAGRGRMLPLLVVDDNEINLRVAVGMLQALGFSCDTASDGVEAVRLAMANDYAMVFMDVQMPRMDGITATRAIRGHEAKQGRPRTPIAGLTCLVHANDRARGLDAGMDIYLNKPVDTTALTQALSGHARRRPSSIQVPAASSSAGNGTGAIDPVIAARLRDLPGGLAVELWKEFADDLPARCSEIEAVVSAGDAPAAHRLLHALKGSAGTLGLMRLHGALAACDDLARQAKTGWQKAWTPCQALAEEARQACCAAAGTSP